MKDWLSKMRLRAVYAISTSDPQDYFYGCNVHEISVILIYCLDTCISIASLQVR